MGLRQGRAGLQARSPLRGVRGQPAQESLSSPMFLSPPLSPSLRSIKIHKKCKASRVQTAKITKRRKSHSHACTPLSPGSTPCEASARSESPSVPHLHPPPPASLERAAPE